MAILNKEIKMMAFVVIVKKVTQYNINGRFL